MKITFIIASVGKQAHGRYVNSWLMEPLGIAVLSSLTPKAIQRVLYDDRLEDIPFDEPTDLVAINMETYTAARAYQIAGEYRRRNVKVVLGGFHATLMPDEALSYADAVVVGEAEGVWGELLDDFSAGRLKRFYKQNETVVIKDLIADRSIFNGKKYINLSLVETGRGCKFGCEFCSVARFFDSKYKKRSIDAIVKEIKQLKNRMIFFVDDNIGIDSNHAKNLFRALIPLKIKWMSQVSMHICNDEELLGLMVKSGCQGVLVGFESLNPVSLQKMGKEVNQIIKDYKFVVRQFHRHNIAIYATFIMGYDDTEQTFKDVYRFGLDNKLMYLAFNHLVPFPGTPLYKRFKRQGRLLYDKWWLKPGYRFGDLVFHPSTMSADELTGLCLKYRYAFFSLWSNLRRLLNKAHWSSPQRFLAYIVLNLFANRETAARRSLIIGGLDSDDSDKDSVSKLELHKVS
ncbi:MAG: radical SAM protein [Candidatus Omnitrophica bacterium]|nr:radical SAM protein [Candidatus Omnitrophota bacterium]